MQQTRNISDLTRIAEGREAEIFAWENGAIIKLYRDAEMARSAPAEIAAMTALRAAGGPVPESRGIIEFDGRTGLIMERVEGIDLLTELASKPWRVAAIGAAAGRTHAALHATQAPASMESIKDRLTRRFDESPLIPPKLGERALASLTGLPDGDRLLHGDFHPGNVIGSARGPIVIDWPNSARGDPHADVARSLLMLRLGEPPPGSPPLLLLVAKFGRSILIGRYRSAYRKGASLDEDLLRRWMLPVAIHRLGDGITEERERLLAYIETL